MMIRTFRYLLTSSAIHCLRGMNIYCFGDLYDIELVTADAASVVVGMFPNI